MFDVKKTLRLMMKSRGFSFRELAEKYNELIGTEYTESAMMYKINHEKIKVTEMQIICDIIGFEFWLINRETKQKAMVIPLKETLKRLFESKGMSQDAVRREYCARTGDTIGQTGFSTKVTREIMRVTELQTVADILNYDVVIINPATELEFNEQGDKPVKIGGLSDD